jgi:hypothetical protein
MQPTEMVLVLDLQAHWVDSLIKAAVLKAQITKTYYPTVLKA